MSSEATPVNTQETTPRSQKQLPERKPGNTMLPLARVKRVIKEDKDVSLINAEATFCIAYATELFMEYLVTEAFNKAKKEKRKTVYYKDLASTVKEIEQFEFLDDVIPTTMTLKQAIEKRKQALNDDTPLIPPSKKLKTTQQDPSNEQTTTTTTTTTVEEEDEDDTVMEDPKHD